MKNEVVVISLGGSLIVPGEIDWKFLKAFRKLILKKINKGKKFIIITGGGKTCRSYQQAASKVTKLTNDDRDWIGIHTTRLNAHLIKTVFRKHAYPKINKNPQAKENLLQCLAGGKSILVASGWKPGWSTDYVATALACRFNAKTLLNLSNIDHVYDRDPKTHPAAKVIERLSWKEFRKIVGNKWDPGLNAPFDPVAAKLAQKQGLKVIIANGKNMGNLELILESSDFVGTIIEH